MKKDKILTGLIIADAVLALLNIGSFVLEKVVRSRLAMKDSAAASVSVIGGADGPTSIFLSGKIGLPSNWLPIALLVSLIVTAGYAMVKGRK